MSSSKHICNLCNKEFRQKSDLTKHNKKKTPCISINEIKENLENERNNNSNNSSLKTIFKYILNVLRDNESLTGDKALRTISYFLDLRLLEKKFNENVIDIDNRSYYFPNELDNSEEEQVQFFDKLLKLVRFSELSKSDENDLPTRMKHLWKYVLSKHPSTKNIFMEGKCFDIKNQNTYKKIITKLSEFNFEEVKEDIIGASYEELIKDIMVGKVLGQFFTQPILKDLMVEEINPRLLEDGTCETVYDPAMGTGGFLISAYRHLKKQSEKTNIPMNLDFITSEGLGGQETESDTFQLAISNMLISTGRMCSLSLGDSIRNPIVKKYDIVLANPPFGIKGLTYEELAIDEKKDLRDEYMPIKSSNAVLLFLQAIIYMLKIGGRCACVLPHGKEITSSNNEIKIWREFIMKTCELKEVIYLPAGVFENTSVKTCVFIFTKRKEGNEALTIHNKNNTKKDRSYTFSKIHQTRNVSIYDYNTLSKTKHLLVTVSIEEIQRKDYSLNHTDYIEEEEIVYNNPDITIRTLGEVCETIKGITRNSKTGLVSGLYPFYYCSILGFLYLNTYDYDGMGIIINKTNGSGKCMLYIGSGKYNVGKTTLHFKSSDENILLTKYLFYYLLQNKKILEVYYVGVNQKSITEDELFQHIKIPIPSLEKQQEIVETLDFLYEECNKTNKKKINQLKRNIEIKVKLGRDVNNTIRTLGEVCEIQNGVRIVKARSERGEYPVYGGGEETFTSNIFNREGYNILIARFALSKVCVRLKNERLYLNDSGLTVKPFDINICIHKYIGYYLLIHQEEVYKLASGTGQQNLNMDKFPLIKIPIPTLEKQQEIVEYCDRQQELIKSLEKDIEDNKTIALEFMNGMINENNSETEENKDEEVREGDLEEKYEEIEDVVISDTTSVISQEDTNIYTEVELKKKTVIELKKIAKNKSKTVCGKLKKSDLINKILE